MADDWKELEALWNDAADAWSEPPHWPAYVVGVIVGLGIPIACYLIGRVFL